MATTLARIQLLQKTAAQWAASDPILMIGEIGLADVTTSTPVIKSGDGVRHWSQLPNLMAPVTVANDYVAGTTTTLPPGSSATVTINNLANPPTISIGVPRGDVGPANSLTIGTVTTGPPGGAASATISGTPPNQTLSLVIPRGDVGPANSLTIGTVTTGAPGSPAAATITGTAPNQTLNLTLPQGQTGPQGIQGIQGPPNTLTIGTVTTGTPASATITGTSPNQTLSLVIPPGAPNNMSVGTITTVPYPGPASATITGTPPNQVLNLTLPQGPPGDAGTVLSSNSEVTGEWMFTNVPQFFGFTVTEVNQLKANTSAGYLTTQDSIAVENAMRLLALNTHARMKLTRANSAYDVSTNLIAGDIIGDVEYAGSTPANGQISRGALIRGSAKTDWTATSSEGQLLFYVTPSGSLTPSQQFVLDATQARFLTYPTVAHANPRTYWEETDQATD